MLPGWRSAAANLKRRGLVTITRVPAGESLPSRIDGPPLTAEQQRAVDEIERGHDTFSPIVLEGITGSGKTEVYLAVIAQTIAAGRQALILVPEIGLTPQTLRRFRERLPGKIAVLHSIGLARTHACPGRARRSCRRVGTLAHHALPRRTHRRRRARRLSKQQDGLRYSARSRRLPRQGARHSGRARFGDSGAGDAGER
jgi:primosomal protein N' (replication factor Y)